MKILLNKVLRPICLLRASGLLALVALPALCSSCDKMRDEVVESAYLDPILPEPQYKFVRNGHSSVNILECDLLKAPIDRMYSSYLRVADLSNDGLFNDMLSLYNLGEFGLAPSAQLSASATMSAKREHVLADMEQLFDKAKALSGYGSDYPNDIRRQVAKAGTSGLVGKNIGDDNKFFVDELGVSPAEVFRFYALGAVYMDKMLNEHLRQALTNKELRQRHEALEFLDGHNYTTLEHHWDLAYGYYNLLKGLTAADGLPILKESHRRILYAFIEGRRAMANFRYQDLEGYASTIREELSRAVAVRIIDALQGPNALANLRAGSSYVFMFASQAVGLMRCLPFTNKPSGEAYYTYEEASQLVQDLLSAKGLWDKERISAGAEVVGSFANIAERIAQSYNIKLQDIKR